MNLHLEREVFKQILNKISIENNIDTDILEKDYYVCCVLKELSKKQQELKAYFKGGTAIYKILDTMNRFSEDIDLTVKVLSEESNTKNQKRLKASALSYNIDGLTISKEETIDRKGSITAFYDYTSVFENKIPLQRAGKIQVESTSFTVSEPYETYIIEPIIYKLSSAEEKKILKESFEVESFEIQIIKLERMFVDKIFATEFYYTRNSFFDTSKHLYDITILFNTSIIQEMLKDKNEFKQLIEYKRKEEQNRIGGVSETLKITDFEYFKMNFNTELGEAFENMQNKYIFKEDYKITLEEVKTTLNKLFDIIKEYDI